MNNLIITKWESKLISGVLFLVLITGELSCSSAKQTTNDIEPTTQITTTVTNPTSSTIITTTQTTANATTATSTTTTTPITQPSIVFPTTFYISNAPSYRPTGSELELFQYVFSLINNDRQTAGLPLVTLNYNAAAQTHAQNMLDNFYCSHWGTDGLKPYTRYTLAGGLNNEGENSAYSGWFNPSENPNNYQSINVRDEITALQYAMMFDDAASKWGHRDTILNKNYTKVSLGIAYNDKRLALVQQFEGSYIEFYSAPSISNGRLSLLGKLSSSNIEINNVSIAFDSSPVPLTNDQLTSETAYTDGYSLGERINYILPPPPAGRTYTNLSPIAIIADLWEVNASGQFSIQADINSSLVKGKGIYTIVIVATINGESINITNYSLNFN